jgi:hypothetical protein
MLKYSDFRSPANPPAVIRGLAAAGKVQDPCRNDSQTHWMIIGIRFSHLGSLSSRPTSLMLSHPVDDAPWAGKSSATSSGLLI